ncbi:AraC family transcriptional regulator [Rubellicoccus peritrichatus]|uniref:AraC family transcriptional regulator n=1 Tax=Rubellicoccus peritrichatus TaxID=3080537 RepID=A0AAQ3QUN8_9BACT|nr:AraC family transcriptional regulator [Puniceicoccus sp. CR14]WOO40593.1 AraC family transcriptional regulator [Puniceicoccus sp. CR14]
MDHFSQTKILFWGHYPDCKAWVDKRFDGYYVINYAHSGSLQYACGEHELRTIKGPISWLSYPGPQIRFGWPKLDNSWEHRFIAFSGSGVDSYIRSGLFSTNDQESVYPIQHPERLRIAFDELIQTLEVGKKEAPRTIHMLEGLLLQLHEQDRPDEHTSALEKGIKILANKMEDHPEVDWDFQVEAKQLNISYPHFRRLWRKINRDSPNNFLIKARLKLAATLLQKSPQSIKEIAYNVQFSDVYYFNRMFKKHYKIAPGRFREETRF